MPDRCDEQVLDRHVVADQREILRRAPSAPWSRARASRPRSGSRPRAPSGPSCRSRSRTACRPCSGSRSRGGRGRTPSPARPVRRSTRTTPENAISDATASSSLSSPVIVKWLAPPDQLDPVVVGIADEAQPRAALAHLVGRRARARCPARPAARASRRGRRRRSRCARSRCPARRCGRRGCRSARARSRLADREEVVRRLELAVADDVHVAREAEAERLVERAARSGSVMRTIVCRNVAMPRILVCRTSSTRLHWRSAPPLHMSSTLHLERILSASPEAVFDACVDPATLAEWWGPAGFTAPSLELDLREGGRYRITMQPPEGEAFHLRGEFREIDRPRRLVYTFVWEEPTDDQETVVTLSFLDDPEGSMVVLDQGPFKTEARHALHEAGWNDCFERLQATLARSDRAGT